MKAIEIQCGNCPHFKSEPMWKQLLFVWRSWLWMGRCERGCYKGDLVWWVMPCQLDTRTASEMAGLAPASCTASEAAGYPPATCTASEAAANAKQKGRQ